MWRAVLVVMLASSPAAAQWYGFSSWERLPVDGRVGYVMGIAHSLMVFASSDEAKRVTIHRQECLVRAGMTGQQLTENVLNYGKMHPQLQTGSVQLIVVNYLNELCGFPR